MKMINESSITDIKKAMQMVLDSNGSRLITSVNFYKKRLFSVMSSFTINKKATGKKIYDAKLPVILKNNKFYPVDLKQIYGKTEEEKRNLEDKYFNYIKILKSYGTIERFTNYLNKQKLKLKSLTEASVEENYYRETFLNESTNQRPEKGSKAASLNIEIEALQNFIDSLKMVVKLKRNRSSSENSSAGTARTKIGDSAEKYFGNLYREYLKPGVNSTKMSISIVNGDKHYSLQDLTQKGRGLKERDVKRLLEGINGIKPIVTFSPEKYDFVVEKTIKVKKGGFLKGIKFVEVKQSKDYKIKGKFTVEFATLGRMSDKTLIHKRAIARKIAMSVMDLSKAKVDIGEKLKDVVIYVVNMNNVDDINKDFGSFYRNDKVDYKRIISKEGVVTFKATVLNESALEEEVINEVSSMKILLAGLLLSIVPINTTQIKDKPASPVNQANQVRVIGKEIEKQFMEIVKVEFDASLMARVK